MTDILNHLVEMTRTLGQPHLDYCIIGEGNTSYRADDETFWIKASGQQMDGINADGFVAVRFAPILELLASPASDATAMQNAINAAKVDASSSTRPSVEVTFHAMLLADCGVNCIAHTHPIAINKIMCSPHAHDFATKRMFPDEIVLCGPESAFVPYVDPGLPLALKMREAVRDFMDRHGEPPKVLLMENHGMTALAQNPTEALKITAMCVKAAHIFAGAAALGGPVFMSEADVYHIYKRPDEIYRRKRFVEANY
jgi:rhamnose utilization protein RhaD (predicted bifunctional aldolase and dehydrogenase)